MWFARITTAVDNLRQVCTQVLAAQIQVRQQMLQLQSALENARAADRAFIMSVVTLLAQKGTTPQKVSLTPFPDFHEEVPVGHPEGYSHEELGIYHDPSKTRQQDTADSQA